jgi:ubiquinone/menaquinone biosynthesis C-methylase UbiE
LTTCDFLKSKEEFQLLYDPEKQMLATSPQPDQDTLGSYYEQESYISHLDNKKGPIPFLYYQIKKKALKKKLNLVQRKLGKTGTLLDIGTGTGDFILNAKKQGWEVKGTEPNAKAMKRAIKKGLNVASSLETISKEKFDAITLWHVLEHVPNLQETINMIENMLKPEGVLLVAVPNFRSFDARFYKEFWAAYDVPRHLWHFSGETMGKIFSKDLELVSKTPMIFDSFYVSLLSENYKGNLLGPPRAFLVGLWSNISAWRSKEYSSLIYCFRKRLKSI